MTHSFPDRCFFQIEHLAAIEVTGEHAAQFLQGQLTCNIAELTQHRASFAGFCTAKGRVISCLIVIKRGEDFLMVLPSCLLDKVIVSLRRYVLRSKVALRDLRDDSQLLGATNLTDLTGIALADTAMSVIQQPFIAIRLPSPSERHLCILANEQQNQLIERLQQQGFSRHNSEAWRYLDIGAGIPWFNLEQSELYIPQMLNLDKLGGISFNKGCYTGQEIVARTHYLGHSKRELYIAEADQELNDECLEQGIFTSENSEKIGNVLSQQNFNGRSRLLLILQTVDASAKNLILANANRTVLKLLPSQ